MCGVSMKKLLLLISLFASLLCAQSFQIKQITNLNADCRNFNWGGAYFAFEAHNGNSSNIYMGQYYQSYPVVDSFATQINITNNNFMNINPQFLSSTYDSLFIIYQTNMNGNWDIVYRVYLNNQLSPAYYVANSSSDEINPVVFAIDHWPSPSLFVSYEKGNSIYIRAIDSPGLSEIEFFHGNDSTKYSQVSIGAFFNTYVAARKVTNGKSFIIYQEYDVFKGWGKETVLANSDNCRNPRPQLLTSGIGLCYTDDINEKSNLFFFNLSDQSVDTLKLFDYPLYNYDNFRAQQPIMITKKQEFYNIFPYTYTAARNDSLFIRVNKLDMVIDQQDTLVYTKVTNNHLFFDSFGGLNSNEIFYSIWEDSISGNIQLLGKRYLYPISSVKDDYSPSSFTLYQNYPNPFNPSTTISYRLKEKAFVKLDVYDITGKLIKVLVNQIKDPGLYETEFNAKGLASGIYFYRLEVFGKGSSPVHSEIKKLVLLK
jgi:hypothetical protein